MEKPSVQQILQEQIDSINEEITKNKVAIADLFVKIHNLNPKNCRNFEEFLDVVKEMEKMHPLLEVLSVNKTKLDALLDSQRELAKAY